MLGDRETYLEGDFQHALEQAQSLGLNVGHALLDTAKATLVGEEVDIHVVADAHLRVTDLTKRQHAARE